MPELMNLEDDTPAPDPTPTPAPEPVPVAAAPAPAPDADDDLQPADLVDAEKASGLIGAIKALRGENKELKGRAAQVDQLQTQLAQMQGALATFQQLQQRAPAGPAPAPAPTTADPELVELAKSLDYYRQDGTPDTDRAAKHDAIIQRRAQRIAQQALAPLAEMQHRDLSARNFQQAIQTPLAGGLKPKPETLSWIWQNLPAELTANPNVAQVLNVLALGLDTAGGQQTLPPAPAPVGQPPIVTEAVGAAPRRAPALTATERMVIQNRGVSEEKYQQHVKDFRPGRTNSLED